MILVSRRMVLLLLILSVAMICFLGIRGYYATIAAGNTSGEDNRFNAETILYIMLLSTIAQVMLFSTVLVRSRRVFKELDRIIELSRIGNISLDESLKRMGRLGQKIKLLHSQLNELNQKRSLKISALSEIIEFLLNNSELIFFITDITGRIEKASRKMLEKYNQQNITIRDAHISNIFPDLDYQDTFFQLEKRRNLFKSDLKEPLTFFPIFNREGELANIIGILGREKIYEHQKTEPVVEKRGIRRLAGFMKRMMPARERTKPDK